MISTAVLTWFTSDQGLMAVLAHNWLLGTCMIAGVIFVETGLVVMPFLPGDSLLFAAGALLGLTGISPLLPITILALAAIAGDATNYAVGRSAIGQLIIRKAWVKPQHLAQTHDWFERYGGMTITVGRFIPIVRTVAPFLAGLSGMRLRQFAVFNVAGGVLWCGLLTMSGYWLGQVSWVREHLQWLSLAIVVLSVMPVAWHFLIQRRNTKESARAGVAG